MSRKVLVGGAVVVLGLAIALLLFARSILSQDGVRGAVAAQLSRALGQPVAIDGFQASVFPRVTISLQGVRIGNPARIEAVTLRIATGLGALLRRRIENAAVHLDGARIELPLSLPQAPTPPAGADEPAGPSSAPPVELVSIDEIILRDVEIVSGGRTLEGDVEVALRGRGLSVRRVALSADGMSLEATGDITDLAGPVGSLTVTAGAVDFDQLMAFVADFTAGAGLPSRAAGDPPAGAPSPAAPAGARQMRLAVDMQADGATFGTLAIENLAGRMLVTAEAVTLDPVSFGVFGGRYEGALALTPGDTPAFELNAGLSGVDVARAMAFAGSEGLMTGTLAGRLEVAGRGMEASSVLDTARGSLRVDVVDGVVSNLGLVRAVVVATSSRASTSVAEAAASRDEPFTRLGTTLAIANGQAKTSDLRFESRDLDLSAEGSLALDGSAINLAGQIQLSEALTKEAGTDLVRYTSDQGRVTFPVTVTGAATNPSVRIDIAAMAGRAIRNRAAEEAKKVIGRGLGGLLR